MLWLVQVSLLPWPPLSLEASFSLQDSSSAPSEMPLHVQGQVVRPGETPVTVRAFKRLGTSMLSEVSGQLITSCKTPLTTFPRASVRLFSCVSALMCFQVGAFSVNFPAAVKMAPMYPSSAIWGGVATTLVARLPRGPTSNLPR